jgi:predicted metal-dependent phosphoesterase TrpH
MAITDHDEVRGSLEAEALAGRFGLGVIPGIEVSTWDRTLQGLLVRQPISRSGSLRETVQEVGRAGGQRVAPHPLARVGSRDSHLLPQVGSSRTAFLGQDGDD